MISHIMFVCVMNSQYWFASVESQKKSLSKYYKKFRSVSEVIRSETRC